ncbi:unnamed protein product [Dicrocoelium dendriticum]|nr:unnamed protein product [Dicrocoelium dendriticum]
MNCDPPQVDRERLLADVRLRNPVGTDSQNQNGDSENESVEDRLRNVKNLIQGNIDALDYLRGISSLEKCFSNLVEEVIRTAVVLSQANGVSYPQHVYDPSMEGKVDRCWTYIRQLTDVVHWHVTQAIRYHKFYHDIKTSQMELAQFAKVSVTTMSQMEALDLNDLDQLAHVNKAIQEQQVNLIKLEATVRQLSLQARTVAPLQYRHPLPNGRHSAEVLASMRLPDGTWLHRGDPVKAWVSNAMASELHREWQAETIDGNQTATLPSLCLWLTSPCSTPESSLRDPETTAASSEVKGAITSRQPETSKIISGSSQGGITSAKALAHLVQNDLLSHWMDMVNEFARLLLPVYKKFIVSLSNIKGDLSVTNMEETTAFFEQLKPLIQYGEPSELELLDKLTHIKLRTSSVTMVDQSPQVAS